MRLKAEFSKSFVQNIFRGIVEPAQAFPYPRVIFTTCKYMYMYIHNDIFKGFFQLTFYNAY